MEPANMRITSIGRFLMEVTEVTNSEAFCANLPGTYVLVHCDTPIAAFLPGNGILYQRESIAGSEDSIRYINEWRRRFGKNITMTEVTPGAIQSILDA
tara:strand:+ start:744 stop:1037 length:294 start_codon:yes stop_codon:yes gene_type:complete